MYRDNLEFSENFRQSVNISIDLHNEDKINAFIATETAVDIMAEFIYSFESQNTQPHLFIGPYGKGKSHLLLALSELLYSKNFESCSVLVKNLCNLNSNFIKTLDKIRNKRYLPIVMNGSYDSFKSTLIYEIKNRLDHEGLTNFDFKTSYTEAINILTAWSSDKFAKPRLIAYEDENNISKENLFAELENTKISSLKEFERLYKYMMYGQDFEPLVKSDISGILQEVSSYLVENTEFDGVFLILDEFSKLLEGNAAAEVYADIQNIAEITGRFPLKTVCVAHKRIGAYTAHLSDDKRNEWKKIEGRFSQLFFGHFEDQSYYYRLIEKAIVKNNLNENKLLDKSRIIYNRLIHAYESPLINQELVVEGSFPMNPYTTYALIKLSEIVGQNERSLFSFLCDDQSFGLKKIVQKDSLDLVSLDVIYDYFKNAIENDKNSNSYKTYIKAETIINEIDDLIKIKIIKALAVIYIIDDVRKIPPTEDNIKYSLNIERIEMSLEELVSSGNIIRKAQNGHLGFMVGSTSNIQNDINKVIDLDYKNISFGKAYKELFDNKYIVPKRHNYSNSITRFFKVLFIDESIFLNEGFDISQYLALENADGYVVFIVSFKNNYIVDITDKINTVKLNNVIMAIISDCNKEYLLMKNLLAINDLLVNKKKNGYDEFVTTELKMLAKEYEYQLETHFNELTRSLYSSKLYYMGDQLDNDGNRHWFNNHISIICDQLYRFSPKMNYEMLNKNQITSVSKRGRRYSLNKLFDTGYEELSLRDTSAEKTMYRVLVQNTGIENVMEHQMKHIEKKEENNYLRVLNCIHQFFTEANEVTKIKDLYIKLESEPFGLRRGIIPFFLVKYLSEYKRNVIIISGGKELPYTVSQLEFINEQPENFVAYISHETAETEEFLKTINNEFMSTDSYNNLNIYDEVFKRIEKYMHRLPKCTTQMSYQFHEYDYSKLDKSIIQLRNEFLKYNQNAKEVLVNRIPRRIYAESSYKEITKGILGLKEIYGNYVDDMKRYLINYLKETFSETQTKSKLRDILVVWYKNLDQEKISYISDSTFIKFVNYVGTKIKNKDEEVIEDISYKLISVPIESWNDTSLYEFENAVANILDICQSLDNLNKKSKDVRLYIKTSKFEKEQYYDSPELTSDASSILSEFEELLEEYMISANDKEAIVLEIITKHLKGEL